jgi:hypothetical protein
MPMVRSLGVVELFPCFTSPVASSKMIRSVNVPPMSNPMFNAIPTPSVLSGFIVGRIKLNLNVNHHSSDKFSIL